MLIKPLRGISNSRSSEGICGREHDDPMDDLDVNMAICCIFLNTTLHAAVHLRQDFEANLRFVKNHLWTSEQKEIIGVGTIGFKDATWTSTRLIVQQSLSGHQRQKPASFPTLCSEWRNVG